MATAGVWEKLSPPLSESTLQVLHETLSFDTMTPVQAAAIPLMLSHKDVAVEVHNHYRCLSSCLPHQHLMPRHGSCYRSIISFV